MKTMHLMHLVLKLNMRFFAVLILVLGSSLSFGQSIRFQLYRTGPCSAKDQLDTAYSLYKAPFSIDTSFLPKKGIVYLPGIGKYKIYFDDGPIVDTTIDIRDTGLFVFRYAEPFVGLYPGGIDMPPVYASCGKRINGYFQDFYQNGKIKIRGDFVHGYPKDSIVTYYANGALKSKERVFKKETVFETFDSLTHRIKITRRQNGSIISYRWRRSAAFFADGSLKLKESDVNRICKIKEYYLNGRIKIRQTKRRRVEKLENGHKKVVFRWRKKIELFKPREKGIHDNTIHQVAYDENGRILQMAVYEVWDSSVSPPALELEKADWIVSLKKFKDGKEIYSVADVDTKSIKK
ncbi:MAG TPA: hypothetical protein VFE53_23170 [Mucilaginibacter sp.]|jgi:antitoxin component YwqK of YwqJK toxin-antitoxin module|nr:hypothetical protein [Mucilaginibacter sp.]